MGQIRGNVAAQPIQQGPFPNNVLFLTDIGDGGPYSGPAHEVAHTFSLLHTFGTAQNYIYPPSSNQVDYPYRTDMGSYPRELSIRQSDQSKRFKSPNCLSAGDLCCDTPADCYWVASAFPQYPYDPATKTPLNCTPTLANPSPCAPGCAVNCENFNPTYRDYNLDLIEGAPNNLMSYHNCGSEVTPDQRQRMVSAFDMYWSNQYTEDIVNVESNVLFMGQKPMKEVWIQWTHPQSQQYCRSFTDYMGRFKAVTYAPNVTAHVRKLGSGSVQVPTNFLGISDMNDIYLRKDWREGLDLCDVIALTTTSTRNNFNGWQKLAGDFDKSSSTNAIDGYALQKYLMGSYVFRYTNPWGFVPRYIPNSNTTGFDQNPFSVNVMGTTLAHSVYMSSSFLYNSQYATEGYGGIHWGDVVETCSTSCKSQPDIALPDTLLVPGEEYEIAVKTTNFNQVIGFQIGISADTNVLEIKDAYSTTLSGFNKEDNTNLSEMEEGDFKTIWANPESPATLANGSTLMKIRVLAKQPMLQLSNAFTNLNNLFQTLVVVEESVCMGGNLPDFETEITLAPSSEERGRLVSSVGPTRLICYPNPTSNDFSIAFQSNTETTGQIQLTNMNGKVVYSSKVGIRSGNNIIHVSGASIEGTPAGVLTVSLTTSESVKTTRLIKK